MRLTTDLVNVTYKELCRSPSSFGMVMGQLFMDKYCLCDVFDTATLRHREGKSFRKNFGKLICQHVQRGLLECCILDFLSLFP